MNNPPHAIHRRVHFAFALQPFVCAVLGFVFFPVLAAAKPGRTVDALGTAIAFAIFTGVVGALITAFAAYPVFVRLTNRGVTGARTVAFGAAFGNIPAVIAILIQVLRPEGEALPTIVANNSEAIFFGTFLGLACSAVFWSIAGHYVASNQNASSSVVE